MGQEKERIKSIREHKENTSKKEKISNLKAKFNLAPEYQHVKS